MEDEDRDKTPPVGEEPAGDETEEIFPQDGPLRRVKLGEYIIEQGRLRQDEIRPTYSTRDALDHDVLNWEDYTDNNGHDLTFELHDPENPHELPSGTEGYGSGEMIMKQDAGALTDREMFSRYEVALRFDRILDEDGDPITAFSQGGNTYLMQVTVMVRWPRASHEDASRGEELRKNQETMTFVTYIRPRP